MIYFFHHYELPAILQQIRIQEMLLQNQQAGQNQQTALQDNLNNNSATTATEEAGPGSRADPAQPPTAPPPHALPATETEAQTAVGEVRSELNWVTQTAAIFTEALSTSAQQGAAMMGGVNGGTDGSTAEISVVAEFWMGGATGGGATDSRDGKHSANAVAIKTAGDDPPFAAPLPPHTEEASPSDVSPAPPQTDCPPSQSSGTDWDCSAEISPAPCPSSFPS